MNKPVRSLLLLLSVMLICWPDQDAVAQESPCSGKIRATLEWVASRLEAGQYEVVSYVLDKTEQAVTDYCAGDSSLLSDLYFLRGSLFLLKDDPSAAILWFRRARTHAVSLLQLSRIDQNMGALYFTRGEFERSIRYFSHALAETRQARQDSPERMLQLLTSLGSASYEYNRYADAAAWWKQAREVAEAFFLEDSATLSGMFRNEGLACFAQGDWDGAVLMFRKALTAVPANSRTGDPGYRMTSRNLAMAQIRNGEYGSAEQTLRADSGLNEDFRDSLWTAETCRLLAWIRWSLNDPAGADSLILTGLTLTGGVDPADSAWSTLLIRFRLLRDQASMHYLVNRNQEHQGATILEKLYSEQLLAVRALEGLRDPGGGFPASIIDRDSVELFIRRVIKTGDRLILPGIISAFDLLKVADLLNKRSGRPDSGIESCDLPDSVAVKWRVLNRKICGLRMKQDRMMEANGISDPITEKRLFSLLNELDSAADMMFSQQGTHEPPEQADVLRRFSKNLAAHEAALCFFRFGGTESMVFVVRNDTLAMIGIADSLLDNHLAQLQSGLRSADDLLITEMSRKVSNILLGSCMRLLGGVTRLYVVPGSSSLADIPFDILFTGGEIRGREERVADRFAVSFHQTVGTIRTDHELASVSNREENGDLADCLLFAPSFSQSGELVQLQSALTEAGGIETRFTKAGRTVRNFAGDRADEATVVREWSGGRIVHIATHSHPDDRDPERAGLHFWKVPPGDPEDDLLNGILELQEVEGLRLKCDLLTLSACSLGSDMNQIAARFLDAGADRVVTGLWNVSDRHTRQLMIDFYSNYLAGDDFPEALRKARVKMLNDPATASPYFWAPFVLFSR